MDRDWVKYGVPLLILGIIIFYLGYDFGGDSVAAQYTEAGQDLLDILIRGRK